MYVPPRKRLHLELHLSAKVKLIKEGRTTPKPMQKFLSSNYAVGASTVSDILKKTDVLLGQYDNNGDGKKKRFDNACKFDELNKLTKLTKSVLNHVS